MVVLRDIDIRGEPLEWLGITFTQLHNELYMNCKKSSIYTTKNNIHMGKKHQNKIRIK